MATGDNSKLTNFLMHAFANAVMSGANLNESPLKTLSRLLDEHADDIENFLKNKAAAIKGEEPSIDGETVASASSDEDGLSDYEREFVERARAALVDPDRSSLDDFLSGLLTIIDTHHPKVQVTLEGLLERYKGGSIPAAEVEAALRNKNK